MYLVRTPNFIQKLFPNFIWKLPTEEKVVYLTFDDGPIPEVTPWVMEQLDQYNAKATFFCVGENVKKHSSILESLREKGHSIGNHTYNHLSGWQTDNVTYLRNVRKGAQAVHSELFRPPYGRVKPSQAKFLNRHYRVVMWDVLSGDFDPELSKEQCLDNVIKNTKEGSIIVFHDSLKAKEKLEYVLPKTLEYLAQQGYRFEALAEHGVAKKKRRIMA